MDKPDISKLKKEVAELTKGMLNQTLYAIILTPIKPPEDIWAHLPDHLHYMIELEEKGILFASGPLTRAQQKPHGAGLTIVRATSMEHAVQLAEDDPLTKSGFRSYEVFEWHLMEGHISVSLDLSKGTLRLE